jgi:hypothetical protein
MINPVPKEDLEAFAEQLFTEGMDRVVINEQGEAVGPHKAQYQMGIVVEVVFIRKDGWTLGAPKELESVAHKLWADEWIGLVRKPDFNAMPITQYKPL